MTRLRCASARQAHDEWAEHTLMKRTADEVSLSSLDELALLGGRNSPLCVGSLLENLA
jgi:hypothetical protein